MEPNDAGGDADRHNDDDYKPLMGGETDGEFTSYKRPLLNFGSLQPELERSVVLIFWVIQEQAK